MTLSPTAKSILCASVGVVGSGEAGSKLYASPPNEPERWSSSNGKGLFPNNTNAEGNINELKAFNSNGFRVGDTGYINDTNKEMVAWTFRKKEKFFDIVTVNTGNSTNTRHSHNLGSRPHFIIGKSLNGTAPWYSYSEAIGKDKHELPAN